MRVDILENQQVLNDLSSRFVLVAHNQLPELYCSCQSSAKATDTPANQHQPNQYPKNQLASVSEGAGGGNVRTFFCMPDGRVIHYLSGYWKEKRYRFETDWALAQIAAIQSSETPQWWEDESLLAELKSEHDRQLNQETAERDEFMSPAEVEALLLELSQTKSGQSEDPPSVEKRAENSKNYNHLRRFNRLIRCRREAKDFVGRPVQSVLQQIEEEVYTKGAVGCGS